MYLASYLAVVQQIGDVSSGGYFLIFWMFQNPPDLVFSLTKGMVMATCIVLVGCYYGYTASGGPVGVGTATAKSMVLNIVLVHIIGMLGTQLFWGANPRAPIGGCRLAGRRGKHRRARRGRVEPQVDDQLPTRQGFGRRRLAQARRGTRKAPPAGPYVSEDGQTMGRDFVIPGVLPDEPDPYRFHTGRKRDHGGEDAIEIIDLVKKPQFGRARILNSLNLGLPEDQVSMLTRPIGNRQERAAQAHRRPCSTPTPVTSSSAANRSRT